jgi:6-phosphogluconolactonase
MMRMLAKAGLPWEKICLAQVDERIAPPGHPDRNLTHMRACLPAAHGQFLAMLVEQPDLEAAAADYGDSLRRVAGQPMVFDLIHLGLGADGHTASLVPDDPVLDVVDKDVAITGEYQGRRRMTLTFPALNRSRRILWVVTGSEKAAMLARLVARDTRIPAGRVSQERALLLADRAAAEG